LNRKTKLGIAALMLTSMLAGVVIAQILLTKQVTNNMRLLGEAHFVLVRSNNLSAEVTNIEWGDFSRLQSKDSKTLLGFWICINNTGNVPLVIGWNATGLDANVWKINATWGGSSNTPYPANNYNAFRIDPSYTNGYITFYLYQINEYATPGDFSFTLNFNAKQAP